MACDVISVLRLCLTAAEAQSTKMLSSTMLDESEATTTTSSSRWGTSPGLDMTGVHLKVLGGHPIWPVAFYQVMAAENWRAHMVELMMMVDYTRMPLAPWMGGARFYNNVVCGCVVDWTGNHVEPEEADNVLVALGLLHNRVKCVILEEYGGHYQLEVSPAGVLCGVDCVAIATVIA